ncbi:hypothetical protein GN958_ATG00145 [Phytophthora infestans]|uniref:Uncharacterized protein n=1 Tax=Phytophthora infestans TaxID=4787 RepID=A0A8S9VC94_PHYIN|nr:hypothetical protein GN958_ATG00145 [Phytophthora infestans]
MTRMEGPHQPLAFDSTGFSGYNSPPALFSEPKPDFVKQRKRRPPQPHDRAQGLQLLSPQLLSSPRE